MLTLVLYSRTMERALTTVSSAAAQDDSRPARRPKSSDVPSKQGAVVSTGPRGKAQSMDELPAVQRKGSTDGVSDEVMVDVHDPKFVYIDNFVVMETDVMAAPADNVSRH